MRPSLLLFLLSAISATPAPSFTPCPTPISCEFDVNGSRYDLTGVQSFGPLYQKGNDGDSFWLQMCGALTNCNPASGPTTPCGCQPATSQAVCQQSGQNKMWYASGACAAQTASLVNGNLQILYGGGKACGANPRATTVVCQYLAGATPSITQATENPAACTYTLTLQSDDCKAGGGSGGGLGGWIFVIIVVCGLVLYCVVGAGFMYSRGARGGEMIPNLEFWKELPGLMKDGALFAKDKVFGLCGN